MNSISLGRSNSTLTNAYMLVILSLIPCAFGAITGMSWAPAVADTNPWLFFIGMLVAMFGGLALIWATASSWLGIVSMNLFTFIAGNLVSVTIAYGLKKYTNGLELILLSLCGTGIITAMATVYALTTKRDYTSLGGTLLMILIGVIVMGFLNLIFHLPVLSFLLSCVSAILFTVYIIYDVQRAARYETNYIIVATSLFLDMLNLFLNLVDILFTLAGDD